MATYYTKVLLKGSFINDAVKNWLSFPLVTKNSCFTCNFIHCVTKLLFPYLCDVIYEFPQCTQWQFPMGSFINNITQIERKRPGVVLFWHMGDSGEVENITNLCDVINEWMIPISSLLIQSFCLFDPLCHAKIHPQCHAIAWRHLWIALHCTSYLIKGFCWFV